MYIPDSVQRVLENTVTLAKENDRDVPERDRMHDLEAYDEALTWLDEFETREGPLDPANAVEIHCTEVNPGDLFRPVTPDGVENTYDWKVFLDGEMTPNETWYYAMGFADPESGVFEGIHHVADCDPVQVVTMCRSCGDQQAEHDAEVKVEGALLAGPVCSDCYRRYSARPNSK